MRKALLFIFIIAATLSCQRASKQESTGEVFCNINQNEVYSVGTNPAVDFNVTNQTKTTSFNQTDCPQVDNDSFDAFVSRVKRVGNTLIIVEDQYSGVEKELVFTISGNQIQPIENKQTNHNCTITRSWTGTLGTPANGITLTEDISFKGNCAPWFMDWRRPRQ